ncbi:hypothetical protein GGC47_002062 [Bosea sp. OAE752]
MLDAAAHGAFNQCSGFDSIIEIITKRITHRFRNNDSRREMRQRRYAMLGDQLLDQLLIADIPLNEGRFGRNGPPETGREIVENHDLFAAIEQFQHHMTADVAGAA